MKAYSIHRIHQDVDREPMSKEKQNGVCANRDGLTRCPKTRLLIIKFELLKETVYQTSINLPWKLEAIKEIASIV